MATTSLTEGSPAERVRNMEMRKEYSAKLKFIRAEAEKIPVKERRSALSLELLLSMKPDAIAARIKFSLDRASVFPMEQGNNYVSALWCIFDDARKSCTIVSDTFRSEHFCNKAILEKTREKVESRVAFRLLSGKELISREKGHRFLEMLFELKKRKELRHLLKISERINRPPAHHYFIVDDLMVFAEVIHQHDAKFRQYYAFTDPLIVGLYKKKFDICVSERYTKPVQGIERYDILKQFSDEYEKEYERVLQSIDIKTAIKSPGDWMYHHLILEATNQVYRKRFLNYVKQYGEVTQNNWEFLRQNEEELIKKHRGNWIAIHNAKVVLTDTTLDGVMKQARSTYPDVSFSAILFEHMV